MTTPEIVERVSRVEHAPNWRGSRIMLNFVLLNREPGGDELLDMYRWALARALPNPRVISPGLVAWSSLFHPRFYHAVRGARHRAMRLARPADVSEGLLGSDDARVRFWLQSVVFLACVSLSAAIIQGRWSAGTLGSKYDRLWHVGQLAAKLPCFSALAALAPIPFVEQLVAADGLSDLERLLALRHKFEQIIGVLAVDMPAHSVRMQVTDRDAPERFGFVPQLREQIPGLECVIVYGSSIVGSDFADYDAIVIVDDPERVLRALYNAHPTFQGKELNLGIYSKAEFWAMQLLSGDNLADYGVCLFGAIDVPHKPSYLLLLRNMSFGLVRQRQQLGMVAHALLQPKYLPEDKANLYNYFVKIPANIVKGTLGVDGGPQSKTRVLQWLIDECGFDTLAEQRAASEGRVASALARSGIATGAAMTGLNRDLNIVEFL